MTWAEIIHSVKVWCGNSDERRYLFVYYLGCADDHENDIWTTNESAFDAFYDKKNMLRALRDAKANPDEIEYPRAD